MPMFYRHDICRVLVEPRGGSLSHAVALLSTEEDQDSERWRVVVQHGKLLHLSFGFASVSSEYDMKMKS